MKKYEAEKLARNEPLFMTLASKKNLLEVQLFNSALSIEVKQTCDAIHHTKMMLGGKGYERRTLVEFWRAM